MENLVSKVVVHNKEDLKSIFEPFEEDEEELFHMHDLALHTSLLSALKLAGIVKFLSPLHSSSNSEIKALRDKCFWNGSLHSVPVDDLNNYFGGRVAMYVEKASLSDCWDWVYLLLI